LVGVSQVFDQQEWKAQAVELCEHPHQRGLVSHLADQDRDASTAWLVTVDHPDATEQVRPVGIKKTLGENAIAGRVIQVQAASIHGYGFLSSVRIASTYPQRIKQ
jgi:hypothetical protein